MNRVHDTNRFVVIRLEDPSTHQIECPVCCNEVAENELRSLSCCSTQLCSLCFVTHLITKIREGKAKIDCPACSNQIDPSTILYNVEIPGNIRERYQEVLAQDLCTRENMTVKLCPHCNLITILDEKDPRMEQKKSRGPENHWIHCEQCNQDWCWSCYAPAHPNDTCRAFRKTQNDLDRWAKRHRVGNPQQRNAQRCPKCSIYIEKIDGCDHMSCAKCDSKFCYRCGARMRLPYYVGHDARFSIFGCKYKLWPDRPCLRWLVRGSIFTGVLILTPIVLVLLLALVIIAIPVLLIVGFFALPIYICIECKKRS